MDKPALEKMTKMLEHDSETDAIMGLRGIQGGFKAEGVSLSDAILFAFDNMAVLKTRKTMIIDQKPTAAAAAAAPAAVTTSGMPNCRAPKPGHIELIPPGKETGTVVALPGLSAENADSIAFNLKDALVAAIINKSRFKLKLFDVKNVRGEISETILQAEYERAGMATVRVWANVRGEAAGLATILRKAVADAFPDLYGA